MHLSKEQLAALVEAAGQSKNGNQLRDKLMILVTTCHGLRASEVISLTTASIVDGHLKVHRLKGSDTTVQPILPCEIELLAYAASLPDGARLFPVCRQTFYDIIQKYGKAAGVPSHLCHPHALKATCAKLALRNGVGIDDLQTYIGWKSLASATAYLRSDETEASVAFGQVWNSLLPA
jgi:integrase